MCKSKRNILQFTYDIEECIDVIQEEISKVSFEEFVNDRKTIGVSVFEMEDLLKYIYLLREKLKY